MDKVDSRAVFSQELEDLYAREAGSLATMDAQGERDDDGDYLRVYPQSEDPGRAQPLYEHDGKAWSRVDGYPLAWNVASELDRLFIRPRATQA